MAAPISRSLLVSLSRPISVLPAALLLLGLVVTANAASVAVKDGDAVLAPPSLSRVEALVHDAESGSRATLQAVLLRSALPSNLDAWITQWASAPGNPLPDAALVLARDDRVARVWTRDPHLLPDYVRHQMQAQVMDLLAQGEIEKALDLGIPMLGRAMAGDLREFDAPPDDNRKPPSTAPLRSLPARDAVVDDTGGLGKDDVVRLSEKVRFIETTAGIQLCIWVIGAEDPHALAALASQALQGWRLDQAPGQRGLILVVAPARLQALLRPAYGLEAKLSVDRREAIVRDLVRRAGKSFNTSIGSAWPGPLLEALDDIARELGALETPPGPSMQDLAQRRLLQITGACLLLGWLAGRWLHPAWAALAAAAGCAGAGWWLQAPPALTATIAVLAALLCWLVPSLLRNLLGRHR